jgi:hypothetical protein
MKQKEMECENEECGFYEKPGHSHPHPGNLLCNVIERQNCTQDKPWQKYPVNM